MEAIYLECDIPDVADYLGTCREEGDRAGRQVADMELLLVRAVHVVILRQWRGPLVHTQYGRLVWGYEADNQEYCVTENTPGEWRGLMMNSESLRGGI